MVFSWLWFDIYGYNKCCGVFISRMRGKGLFERRMFFL